MGFASPSHWLLNCSSLWQEHLHNSFSYATVLKSSSFSTSVLLAPYIRPSRFLQFLPIFYFSLLSVLMRQRQSTFSWLAEVCMLLGLLGEQETFHPRDTGKQSGTSSENQTNGFKHFIWLLVASSASLLHALLIS